MMETTSTIGRSQHRLAKLRASIAEVDPTDALALQARGPRRAGPMSPFTQAQRSFWDGFAAEYERRRERATSLVAATLHRQLRLEHAASVLEVGTGAGAGALDLACYVPSVEAVKTGASLAEDIVRT